MKKIDKIVLIGASGSALNILYQIDNAIKHYNYPADIKGILIDSFTKGQKIGLFSVIGPTSEIADLTSNSDYGFIFCLYKMDKMKERWELLQGYGIPIERMPNFIHPLAYVSSDLKIGHGNVIMSNSSIQSGVEIGNNNIINSGVTVEHETKIGNGNFLAANSCLGAQIEVGNHCFIGLNSSIREKVVLGDNVLIGMHSLVLKNFNNCKVAGVPAKVI